YLFVLFSLALRSSSPSFPTRRSSDLPLVSFPVASYQSGSVHREDHMQVLNADVMDHLVKGALQKRRVDRHDRNHSRGGKPGGERDRKSTRLNSSHVSISYAVFCLKKK